MKTLRSFFIRDFERYMTVWKILATMVSSAIKIYNHVS